MTELAVEAIAPILGCGGPTMWHVVFTDHKGVKTAVTNRSTRATAEREFRRLAKLMP